MTSQLPPELWSMILKFKVDHYVCELKEYYRIRYEFDSVLSRITVVEIGKPHRYDIQYLVEAHPSRRTWEQCVKEFINGITWRSTIDDDKIIFKADDTDFYIKLFFSP